MKSSVLLRDSIIAWKELRKHYKLPFFMLKGMPLWGHPEFTQGRKSPLGKVLQQKGILVAGHLMHPETKRWLSWKRSGNATLYLTPTSL